MFRTYTLRPQPNVEAVHVTRTNFEQVAAHFQADIRVPVTGPGRPYMSVTLPSGGGRTVRELVGIGAVIVKHTEDRYTVSQHIEQFDAEWHLKEGQPGTPPEFADIDKVAHAVKTLTSAGNLPADVLGPYNPATPDRNIAHGGFLVLPLPGPKVVVRALPRPWFDIAADLGHYEADLYAAGYQTRRRPDGRIVASLPV